MITRLAILVVLSVGLATALAPAKTVAPERRAFVLDGRVFTLPLRHGVALRHDLAPRTVLVIFGPDRRSPRVIAFFGVGAPRAPAGPFPLAATLGDGVRLRYDVDVASGGSGGPEAVVTGEVTLTAKSGLRAEPATLGVRCSVQSERPPPRAAWCLPVLAGLAWEGLAVDAPEPREAQPVE